MKWLLDENFNGTILRGLLDKSPGFDALRAQDIPEIATQPDIQLLAWATEHQRVVLSHDISSMGPARQALLQRTAKSAVILLVPMSLPVGQAIEDILLFDQCGTEGDLSEGVLYLPLK